MSDIPDWIKALEPKTPQDEDDDNSPLTKTESAPPSPEAADEGYLAVLLSPEEETPPTPKERKPVTLGGLKTWQSFVLVSLLFLDIVVIGALFLVMLGRFVLP